MLCKPSSIIIILFFSAFGNNGNLLAQQIPAYQTISTSNGLSQGFVYDILQDHEGFIWVATKNGLNRYDGYDFKIYANDPYNAYSISSGSILKLFEDSKGHIWIGTQDGGLNVFDKTSGKFYHLDHNPSDASSISGHAIGTMQELPDGRMLVTATGSGLNIVQLPPSFFEKNGAPVISRISMPANVEGSVVGKDSKGSVFIQTDSGIVYRFNPFKSTLELQPGVQLLNNGYLTTDGSFITNHNHFFLSDGKGLVPLFNIKKIRPGNIVFGARYKKLNGIPSEFYHLNINNGAFALQAGKKIAPETETRQVRKMLYPFIIDRSGLLWTGTAGYGLRKYSITGTKFKTQFPNHSIKSMVATQGGQVYSVNFEGQWKKLQASHVEDKTVEKITSLASVNSFLITSSGDFWIQDDFHGYSHYSASTGKMKAVPALRYGSTNDKQPMLEDSKGTIWLPGFGGNIYLVHKATQQITEFNVNAVTRKAVQQNLGITALLEDANGTFWVGTPGGFFKVSQTGVINSAPLVKWFCNMDSTRNSLNSNHVSTILNDPAEPDKYLWIGTKGGGLNRLNKITGDFFHLTKKDGLPDDVVYGILPDDEGNIWGSTNKGIFCLASPKKNNGKWVFRNFTKGEGLQDDEFNTGAYAKLANGNLAFGGVNGLNIFNPKEVLTPGFIPNVFITGILVNNQSISPGDETGVLQNTVEHSKGITINHQQNVLTLEFTSLDFTAPAQNKYRYQLAGVDKDWVESGTRRSATYLHLSSGNYVFKVQGSNSQGIWSDKISELKIKVLPPLWRTWWAYTIYALLLAWAIRAYIKFNVNRAKLRAQLNFEKIEARRMKELDTVKTQLYTNITHEFRTPLTVILGIAQQLDSKAKQEYSNGLGMIIRNGKSLLKLVNEMLDLSKLETGNMQLQLTHGDVINFLRYVTESFQSLAEGQQKGLHFLTGINALHVAYDAEKLSQVLVNLVSNALKFTNEKANVYITISQNVIAGEDAKVNLVIEVKDTGIGIPEDKLLHIFDRFYQIDNSHTRSAEGTGIGLSLTKELVKLMSGGITVESPPSGATKGTAFTVVLPLQKVVIVEEPVQYLVNNGEANEVLNGVTTVNTFEKEEEKNKDKPLLLLVEDNADVVAYTASCLPDYRLAVGKDGREGFEIAKEMIPDLIVTDVMMPFVDGFEMVKRLRKEEHTSHIPIIILTAKAGIESKLEGLQQGVDAYLEKPFHKEELLLRIKKLLELRQNLQQYYLRKAGITNTETTVDTIIKDAIVVNKTEDEFVKKVREAVEANFNKSDFNIEELCKLVFMSHSQLHRKLEALTGYSPNKFIRAIRLAKAKELLLKKASSISSVAYDCGYSDPAYFARVFKQELGVSPQEWRMNEVP